jgi:hypothetical protein
VLLHPDRRHQQDGVHMIRRGDDQGIEVLGFVVEHLPGTAAMASVSLGAW